ncbi:DNA adenine methylase [Guyparkeria halophila]|uniref:site-specific DNA-methyltransferase (adenine-specific) n=1 Tax=Guyparkeria halophila TaxID=47960 RepID=A0ABZ0YU42_9GAMM|nr:DNA adenine methylase [Guyparkeria halophila]WQH15690.1 DNA adenine methylase [Guyparkeria halophila]
MANPIIPWMGGKRRLARRIIPLIPSHECYVEPFAGAGAIFFRKDPSRVEVLNDVDADLVNLYRVVQHHLEEFVRQFKWALVSRQSFLWNQHADPDGLTDIQRAARFYYLQKLTFGAKPTGRTFGVSTTTPPRLNLLRMEEDLSEAHLRLSRVVVERLDWLECMRRYDRPSTFFYCDPPYWETAGYGKSKDLNLDHYEELAKQARDGKAKVMVSINDHPDIREVFRGFDMTELDISYTVGGKRKAAKELLIRSWH